MNDKKHMYIYICIYIYVYIDFFKQTCGDIGNYTVSVVYTLYEYIRKQQRNIKAIHEVYPK